MFLFSVYLFLLEARKESEKEGWREQEREEEGMCWESEGRGDKGGGGDYLMHVVYKYQTFHALQPDTIQIANYYDLYNSLIVWSTRKWGCSGEHITGKYTVLHNTMYMNSIPGQ